ncbi:MAG: recombinase family protein [Thiomonas arsenitoxydans]|uniref:Recombinase family protein n=1 Tax=Thiomonas arsenitoxydans (strain DSM 22701 / CIP 110005 / 3As) TaxID=426114 RepID=A0A8I1SXL7_THIA3|nr:MULTISPECIES: recombinase family protein [Thiomonas]MBN8744651.1 recombinase family protein [Thiomonas arsenitoxydans]ODU94752.1 MAG: recombinase [Thiomonas sp. SCN 64-16]
MGQRIGYARVSTDDQNLDLQFDALHKAGIGDDRLYSDTASGKDAERKELAACLKALREGDTLVVWRLDCLGRSLPDLVRIVGELEQKGVSFESLTEKIETGSAAGKLVFHVFAALAEFERNLIRERTRAGLEAARARGRAGGRKPKLTEAHIKEINEMVDAQKLPIGRIAELYGVSRTTIYKIALIGRPEPKRQN